MLAMSNIKEEEKYLSKFDKLQNIIDIAEDTKINLEYPDRNIREKLEENEKQESKEQEKSKRDFQREMEERRWAKEKEFDLELERERIHLEKLNVAMEIKFKSSYVEANTEDTIVRNYGNTVKLPKLELKKLDGNNLKWQELWDAFYSTIHQN